MGQFTRWFRGNGVWLTSPQREGHAYVTGVPGVGKSSLLQSWAQQDIEAGHGIAVIDPHGLLYDRLVSWLSVKALREPALAQRVVLIDLDDPKWTVGFNPLETVPGIPRERLARYLTDVVVKIWNIDATTAPRMTRLLSASFLALSERGRTLVDLPRLLTDPEWRNAVVASSGYAGVQDYFTHEFPKSSAAIHQWITPALNKIGPLIDDPDARLMLTAGSTINFRKVLDRNLVLLVKLSKGIFSEGLSALLGAFIVAHLQQAAFARTSGISRDRYFLYLDEFQNYTTDNIKDILSESRKYGLSLVLAHQYLDQLSQDLRGAVLNTAGTMVCFRVGYHDATVLAKELFLPGKHAKLHDELVFSRIQRLSIPDFAATSRPLSEAELAGELTQLGFREFWIRQRGPNLPVKQRTLDVQEIRASNELTAARRQLIDTVGKQYGRLKTQVREETRRDQRNAGNCSIKYYEKT